MSISRILSLKKVRYIITGECNIQVEYILTRESHILFDLYHVYTNRGNLKTIKIIFALEKLPHNHIHTGERSHTRDECLNQVAYNSTINSVEDVSCNWTIFSLEERHMFNTVRLKYYN